MRFMRQLLLRELAVSSHRILRVRRVVRVEDARDA